MATPGSPPYYEPTARFGHAAVETNGKVYLWGGRDSSSRPIPASVIEVFETSSGSWSMVTTKGTPPTGVVYCAYTAIGDKIYTYGGWTTGGQFSDALHELNLTTMMWRKLTPKNPSSGPTKKEGCHMVSYNKDMLVVYGGGQGTYSSICDELHVYNLREGTWSSPRVTGTPPGPRADFSFTKIDDQRVVLFGGSLKKDRFVVNNDVYILDMRRWHWSKVPTSGGHSPVGRAYHTTCSLSGSLTGPHQLLTLGGEDQGWNVLGDAWILHLESGTWTQVELPGGVGPRRSHTATVVACAPGSVHLLLFGGSRTRSLGDTIAATTVLQMEGDGKVGEPLRWRVVGVATPKNPAVEWREWMQRADQLIKLARVHSHMKQDKTINAAAASVILIGPPLNGKSSLLCRMLGIPLEVVSSTPVAERPQRIILKKISPTRGVITGSKWQQQSLEDEKLYLVKHAIHGISHESANVETAVAPTQQGSPQRSDAPQTTTGAQRQEEDSTGETQEHHPDTPPAGEQTEYTRATKSSQDSEPLPSFESPEDILAEARRSGKLEEVEELLENTIILHVIDTGGQPEFLEVLPALLTGPSINLLVFKLNEGLEERYVVEYVSPDGSTTEPYVSSFTVEEALFQALSSVSCTAPPVCRSVSASDLVSSSPQSATLLVGTHRDKVKEEQYQATDETLQKKLKQAKLPQGNIIHYKWEPTAPTRVVIPVDNTNPNDTGVSKLRELVNDVLQKQFDSCCTPLTWLFFHLSVRSTNARMLWLRQCAIIARRCGIEDEDELKLALWYLSHQCGVFRYYPDVEELSDIVICDLHLLFDSVNSLISSTFHFKGALTKEVTRIRETGRCPVAKVDSLLQSVKDIPPEKLIKLLKHLCILTAITDENGETKEYYLPFILPPYEVETLQRSPAEGGQPAPLLFAFESKYCPLRIFSALTVHLASPQLQSALEWKLYDDDEEEYKPYRNKVTFHVGEDFDKVTLIARPTFYEVWIDREEGIPAPRPLSNICNEVCSTIHGAIASVKFSLNSSLRLAHHAAFHCRRKCCHAVAHPAIVRGAIAKAGECCFTKLPSPLSVNQRMWFGEPVADNGGQTELPLTHTAPVPETAGPTAAAPVTENRTPLENVDDSQLEDDSHYDVISELFEVTRWFDLGLALGLKYRPTLETIKIENRERVDDCKRDMTLAWLHMQDNVPKKGLPSWRTLVAALRSRPLVADCADIAEEIAQAHRT